MHSKVEKAQSLSYIEARVSYYFSLQGVTMRIVAKVTTYLTLLSLSHSLLSAPTYGLTSFRNRPVGLNKVIQEVGTVHYNNFYDMPDCLSGFFQVTGAYQRSFNSDEVGKYLFFNGTNTMTISSVASITPGVSSTAASNVDIYSENFYLNNNITAGGINAFLALSKPSRLFKMYL